MGGSRNSAQRAPSRQLLGSETPRLFTPPRRRLTRATSAGFEVIQFAGDVLGIALHPWQRWLLIHALELGEDGTFRFRTVVVLVARQNGKTTVVQVLALWRMFIDRAGLVIGTAQNLDLAEEAWAGAVEMAEGVPELADEIAAVDRTNGKKALRLESGERYKVAAASRRGGRGLSGDLVILDELREHQTWEAWAAVTKTTMARAAPQVWALSNAGDDRSVVLNHLRDLGLKTVTGSGDGSVGLFEWSAVEGRPMADPAGWAQANPSLGYMLPPAAVRAALDTDPEPVFRTEVLCQRVPTSDPKPVEAGPWQARCADVHPDGDPMFFITIGPGMRTATINVAGSCGGVPHVELADHRDGVEWLPDRLVELAGKYPGARFATGKAGPAASEAPELARRGVEVELVGPAELAQGCSHLEKLVGERPFTHSDDPLYVEALRGAEVKRLGDGVWSWDWRRSTSNIAPIAGAAGALWLLEKYGAYDPLDSVADWG